MPWLTKFAAAGIAVAVLLLLLAFLAIRYDLTTTQTEEDE